MTTKPTIEEMQAAISDARRGHRIHEYEAVALRLARLLQSVVESDGQPTTSAGLSALAQSINDNARAHGFWQSERNFGEMLMLATSELAEALEEHRQGRPPVWHQ